MAARARTRTTTWAFGLIAGLLAGAGCGSGPSRFALRAPITHDDDARPFRPVPRRYDSPQTMVWVDEQYLRPVSNVLGLVRAGPAVNVNDLDEVPDSSWFTNRRPTPGEVALGACAGDPIGDPNGTTWRIVGAKSDGITPGFIAEDPRGRRYVVKFDVRATQYPELSTSGDVVGTRLYWAAGFNVPCNEVVYVDPSRLEIGPGATRTDETGHRTVLTRAALDRMLATFPRTTDGRIRATASRMVPGAIIGQWRYWGTRDDDPNDVVVHDDRREIRGSRVLAAWLNHRDAREQNTLDSYVSDGASGGHVVHYVIDCGDCLGLATAPERRFFDVVRFDPERWHTNYPNPAFARARTEDEAWMTRILARLTPAHIHQAVLQARNTRPELARGFEETLLGRWRRIMGTYLRELSPLADVTVSGTSLCATDLLRATGTAAPNAIAYSARRSDGEGGSTLAVRAGAGEAGVCVELSAMSRAGDGGERDDAASRYRVVEIALRERGYGRATVLAVHLYDLGPTRGFVIAGVER